jgi:hypothetical protein
LHYTVAVPAATGIDKIGTVGCRRKSSPNGWWTSNHGGCPEATNLVAENRHNAFDFTAQP